MVTINFIVQLIINQFNILNLANLEFTGIITNFTNYSNNQGGDMAANNHIQDEIILYEGGSEAND